MKTLLSAILVIVAASDSGRSDAAERGRQAERLQRLVRRRLERGYFRGEVRVDPGREGHSARVDIIPHAPVMYDLYKFWEVLQPRRAEQTAGPKVRVFWGAEDKPIELDGVMPRLG